MCLHKLIEFQARRLVDPGGGGSKGMLPADNEGVCVVFLPNKLLTSEGLLARPGIEIEKVCPSLRLKSCLGPAGR